MKTFFSLLISIFFATTLSSQILNPVSWSYEVVEKENKIYELHLIANMDKNWAIYSQFIDEGGPIPTKITFEENKNIKLEKGVLEKGELISGYDELFEMTVNKFVDKVIFVQTIQLKAQSAQLKGYVTYMTCDNKKCLPPTDEEFTIQIN